MPVRDNSLVAQYIRSIENPDSIGFVNGRWEQPIEKVHDLNNRGFGVDVIHNDQAHALTNGRQGRWLSEEEERNIRNAYIQDNQRTLNKWTASPYILRQVPSEEKQAMAVGMLYKGDGIGSIVNNPAIRDAYYSGSDQDMQKTVSNHYRNKGFAPRAKLHDQFFNSRKPKETPKFQLAVPQYISTFKYDKGGSLDNPTWDNLSLADKAEMMKVAIANGITTLPEIREAYNEFANGGDKNQDKQGVMQDLKDIVNNFSLNPNTLRKRFYKHFDPYSTYSNEGIDRAVNLVVGGPDFARRKYPKGDSVLGTTYTEGAQTPFDDAVWGTYLKIPTEERKYKTDLVLSRYKPTKGEEDEYYYTIPIDERTKERIVREGTNLKFNQNANTKALFGYNMGTSTIGKGMDDRKGEYISYYDKWDINPLHGDYVDNNLKAKYPLLSHLIPTDGKDAFNGMTDPVSFYDRIYLDDYYGVKSSVEPGDYFGGYLPEVVITPNKWFAKGGKLNNWTMQDEAGYRLWRSRLPKNLRETNDADYDMRAAYKAGMQPEWNDEDKSYHLGSRDPRSGRILKAPHHPTFLKALITDASLGYYPTMDDKGNTYTETWEGNERNMYAEGGYRPSDSIKKRIATWEGSSMKTNRSFEDEARDFNSVVPAEVRNKLSQQQKDALYSYGYNVGMGRLKERVLPVLTAYTEGKASREDVQRAMWASRDNELRGLTTRRNAERELFGGNYRTKFTGTGKLGINLDPSDYTIPQGFFNGFNAGIALPQMQMPNGMDTDPETLYKAPVIDKALFKKPTFETVEPAYNPKQDRLEGIRRLGTVLGMMGDNSINNSLGVLDYVGRIYS